MTFYEMIERYYDEIFPFSDTTFSFLSNHAIDDKPILDIGSATGAYVDEFRTDGFDALGLELEHALAIRREVPVVVGDMGNLPLQDAPTFGLAYCIGNTLVHLPVDEAAGVVNAVGRRLVTGGSFVVQILNYDRIFADTVTALPTIETENVTFEREYVHEGGQRIRFIGRLIAGGVTAESSVMLYGMRKADIEAAAYDADLDVRLYGSFEGEQYDEEESFMSVAVFSK